jgi:hypothetical protein
MWRCPKCGERIDETFDICWKCGTWRDGTAAVGFGAEPADADEHEPGAEADEPDELEGPEDDSAPEEAASERIVELCSAANMVEANCLCDRLAEAGIEARVVGDFLGGAAGGLPLGEATSPRVWVHQSDQARAREVIAQWQKEQGDRAGQWPEGEGTPPWEIPAAPEAAESEPSGFRYRFLSEGFWFAAVICVLAGGYWAWHNWMTLAKYSAVAEARRVAGSQWRNTARYAYQSGGTTNYVEWSGWQRPPARLSICYDPNDPDKLIIGLPTPPVAILLAALGIAALLGFIGWRFR